jgi:hypothetical protein
MADNINYEMLVNEHNQKEGKLLAKIKFYKENKDQLLRIKMLEEELNNLENDLNSEHVTKLREAEENNLNNYYINIISKYCKEGFKMYQLDKKNNRKNSHNILVITVCRRFYINYTFKEINEKEYEVSAYIPAFRLPMDIHGNVINGIYHIENGLTIKT